MSEGTTIEADVEIERPVDEVFAVSIDVKRWAAWQSRFNEIEQTSSGAFGLGTTLRTITSAMGKDYESLSKVTEFSSNEVVSYEGESDAIRFGASWHYENSRGGGTKIHVVMTSVPKDKLLVKLVHPWMSRVFKKRLESDLEGLKLLLEAEPDDDPRRAAS